MLYYGLQVLIDLNFTLNSKDIMLIAISSQGWCLVHTSHSWLSESSLRCRYCWQSSGVASTALPRLWIPDFNAVTSWKSRPTALSSDNKASRFDQRGQEDIIFRWSSFWNIHTSLWTFALAFTCRRNFHCDESAGVSSYTSSRKWSTCTCRCACMQIHLIL